MPQQTGRNIGEQHRNKHQRLCEDDRHHVRSIHLQGMYWRTPPYCLFPTIRFALLNGDLTNGLYQGNRSHEDQEQQHQFEDQHDGATVGGLEAGVDLGEQRVRQTGHDTDHDNPAKYRYRYPFVGDLLAQAT